MKRKMKNLMQYITTGNTSPYVAIPSQTQSTSSQSIPTTSSGTATWVGHSVQAYQPYITTTFTEPEYPSPMRISMKHIFGRNRLKAFLKSGELQDNKRLLRLLKNKFDGYVAGEDMVVPDDVLLLIVGMKMLLEEKVKE